MAKRHRRGPSSPAEILERAALRRGREAAGERGGRRDPTSWGIVAEITSLETSAGVTVNRDPQRRDRILSAQRADAFDALYRARGLSTAEHQAATRYVRDWMARVGVVDQAGAMMTPIDNRGDGDGITMGMIAAGARVEWAHKGVGQADARLLRELVEPLAMHGQVLEWRIVVSRVTGERDKHAQAARVRSACENLRLHYEAVDKLPRKAAEAG